VLNKEVRGTSAVGGNTDTDGLGLGSAVGLSDADGLELGAGLSSTA
jgi:hypothetical protein